MSLWADVDGNSQIGLISGTLMRLIESQQHIATLSFVDTLEEQALLEDLLEGAKPEYNNNYDKYHYLLKTPFRYPPLKWGSRFGQVFEPSIFYAGLSISAVLAESAFYRFVFWHSMEESSSDGFIRTQHTLFSATYSSMNGVKLHQTPFAEHEKVLTDPSNYSLTQELGAQMRKADINAFEYVSARDKQKGKCVGLFSPNAFRQKKPSDMSQWLCELSSSKVTFKQYGNKQLHTFALDEFLIDGRLPYPA